MTNSVHWYRHVLCNEDVLRLALECEVKGQARKWRLQGVANKMRGEVGGFCLCMEDRLCQLEWIMTVSQMTARCR